MMQPDGALRRPRVLSVAPGDGPRWLGIPAGVAEVYETNTCAAAVAVVEDLDPEAVVVDLDTPDGTGPGLGRLAERVGTGVPLLLTHGTGPDQAVVAHAARLLTPAELQAFVERLGEHPHAAEGGARRPAATPPAGAGLPEERLAVILEYTRAGVLDIDLVTGEAFLSPRLRDMLGWDGTDGPRGAHRAWVHAMHPDDRPRILPAARRLVQRGAPYAVEYRLRGPGDEWRWYRSSARAILDGPQGRPVRVVGMLEDVTDFRRLHDQYAQAQMMEAVGRLASGVAHDFRNMLTVILAHAEFLEGALGAGEGHEEAGRIRAAALEASEVTAQLLNLGRRQESRPGLIDVVAQLRAVEPMLRRVVGARVALECRTDGGLGAVFLDPAQFDQVLLNLAINARDAMPEGGRLLVTASAVFVNGLRSPANAGLPEGEYVTLEVTDTGTGMDDKTLGRVFEPFFTTKPPGLGTGMGLPTVYGIVRNAGGLVTLESRVGQGTTVRVFLPVTEAIGGGEGQAARAPGAGPPGAPPAPPTVLLVDDEPTILSLMARVLGAGGRQVLTAGSVPEALRLVEATRIDLLVTDRRLPGGDGLELAAALRRRWPGLPVLVVSGATGAEELPDGDGYIRYLQKPFTPARLAAEVTEALRHAAAR
jgi:two-component system, cell cycle sensor histidine kinase and response regulator CckA